MNHDARLGTSKTDVGRNGISLAASPSVTIVAYLAGRNYPGGSRNDSRREHDDEQANDDTDDDASAECQDRCRTTLGLRDVLSGVVAPSHVAIGESAAGLAQLEHVSDSGVDDGRDRPLALATFVVGSHFVSSNWPG
jgi:hypothetical protein